MNHLRGVCGAIGLFSVLFNLICEIGVIGG